MSSQIQADDFADQTKPIFDKYCYECHGEKKQSAGISLHKILTWDDAFRNHKLMDNIVEQVKSEDMPPDEADEEMAPEDKAALVKVLQTVSAKIKSGDIPENPGRVTIRRLNRNEYNYTIRDLFGIKFQAGRDFPGDGAGGEGFDNMGDALFVQPQLMEKYVAAAQNVITSLYSNPIAKDQVLIAKPNASITPEAAAKRVLSYHATLAYRKRVSDEDIAPLMKGFKQAIDAKLSYEEAMRIPLTAMLMNPQFLFRIEHDEAGKENWKLNQFELATRLSYFLWSSMPDRELFKIADEGKLSDPEVLNAQVKRMIADDKFEAFARHFGGQWIGYEKLRDQANPDEKRFPEFDLDLRVAMYREGVEFIKHLAREDQPILDLIDSEYSFLNEKLAAHYGIKTDLKGPALVKVALNDKRRGGVIGMGSVLTATSLPLRTSPVLRGTWILSSLLGDPPPPPLPDAGQLPADDTQGGGKTFREQLEAHRKNKRCAACHAKIDPLGFGLENFDAIGRWREVEANGQKVDSRAILPGDVEFSTPQELKALLMGGKDKFSRNMVRKLLSYATGRGLEYYDEAALNQLMDELKKNDYKMQQLIVAVVHSKPFQQRSAKR